MSKEQKDLTIRESVILSLICVPLTIGLVYLLRHLESVSQSGWVWWPALLGFIFSVVGAIAGMSSLVWRYIGPTVRRIGLPIIGTTNLVVNRVLEWVVKFIVYGVFAVLLFWAAGDVFDILDKLSHTEFVTLLIAGVVVCYFFTRNR